MSESGLTFTSPPITEVSYSLQFEPLEQFHLGHLGLLWGIYRESYPSAQHQDPLNHEIERFGTPNARPPVPNFQILKDLPLPRIMMISEDGSSLLQVQNDRFIFNWRKIPPDLPYPRYTNLKNKFMEELDKFEKFINDFGLGKLTYNQAEITNVNHIPAKDLNFPEVFEGLSCGVDLSNNMTVENAGFNMKHAINVNSHPIGRLYTTIEKTHFVKDLSEVFVLKFVARANPKNQEKSSAFDTLDLLRNRINTSFEELTTESMHQKWNKVTT